MVAPCYFLACRIFEDAGLRAGAVWEGEEGADLEDLKRKLVEAEKEMVGKVCELFASRKRDRTGEECVSRDYIWFYSTAVVGLWQYSTSVDSQDLIEDSLPFALFCLVKAQY